VLIPSIDLMGGKIVQLVQGEKKALESEDFEEWAARFSSFPLVQLIDLDRAMGQGNNAALIDLLVRRLPCQVGGGVRTPAAAQSMINAGARRIILGSVLVANDQVNVDLAQQFAQELGPERLVFAIDARGGKVATRGWKEVTEVSPLQMIAALDPFCSAFLYTHIDTEGLMAGLPLDPVRDLRRATTRRLIVAGGISTQDEVDRLDGLGADAVVGMALYTGLLKVPYTISVAR
jgi:phosphoribosylformimino-5-aminoimidazole carboxamide ribotide isomerase